jgi:hypothetical protein
LFYTGSSGTNGDCGGTSFFRYVSADNRLTEIARDWWNFKYLAEQDPLDPNQRAHHLLRAGPQRHGRLQLGLCLPVSLQPGHCHAQRAHAEARRVLPGWLVVRERRTTDGPPTALGAHARGAAGLPGALRVRGQLFLGGDSVSAISQLEDGALFVVGKFQRKLAGELYCGIDVTVDQLRRARQW